MQQQLPPHPAPAPATPPHPGLDTGSLPGTHPGPAVERLPPPPQPARWKTLLWSTLALLMFSGILVAACVWTLPDLVNDWRVRSVAEPVSNARVQSGRCSSKLFFNICDATLVVPTKSGTVTREVNYVFTDVHFGSYTVEVMADPQRPELVTTDLGLDKLWNRTITLLVACGLMLAFLIGGIKGMLRRPTEAA